MHAAGYVLDNAAQVFAGRLHTPGEQADFVLARQELGAHIEGDVPLRDPIQIARGKYQRMGNAAGKQDSANDRQRNGQQAAQNQRQLDVRGRGLAVVFALFDTLVLPFLRFFRFRCQSLAGLHASLAE